MMDAVIVYGAGGLGREVLQIVRAVSDARVLGYIDDGVSPGIERNGTSVLGGSEYLDTLDGNVSVVMGISDPNIKRGIFAKLSRNPRISFPNIVHPRAIVSEYASLERGIVIASGCAISVDVSLEVGVFLNVGTVVGHDAKIGDFSSVMPLTAISGNVNIGERCLIGAQSAILQGTTVGDGCTVCMGAVVLRDVPDGATVIGNPAVRVS
ncbi:MAG: NeuD/PglB/VioB family sugar acetyltransferase [Synergistaceae bacterium]|jgi:sugar O-acyltransferase (sialic acid O-acetyltransferase NeuD family)|nr:NeuD/PglB/VioB family sugar acetyltransferase [Synergistaceae bacterium]